MKRRGFCAGLLCLLAAPFSVALGRRRNEMELIQAGVDTQGDSISLEVLEKAVARARLPMPVARNFSNRPEHLLGRVTSLRMDGDRAVAAVDLNAGGRELVRRGWELAAGGSAKPVGENPKVLVDFEFTGAALTDNKVKRIGWASKPYPVWRKWW